MTYLVLALHSLTYCVAVYVPLTKVTRPCLADKQPDHNRKAWLQCGELKGSVQDLKKNLNHCQEVRNRTAYEPCVCESKFLIIDTDSTLEIESIKSVHAF